MSHIPIRVSTLRGDQQIDFDAFVKINEKQVLYCRKGDSFEGARLSRLREKKLKKMFILEAEESLYRKYLERNIDMAFDKNSGKTLDVRSEIVQGATQAKTEEVMESADNATVYNDAKANVLRFVEFLTHEDKAIAHILRMENADQNIAHHGVSVSTLAVGLASRLGLKDTKQIQLLSLGALLHDFEHYHSGLNVTKPLDQFSKEELEKYKKHPQSGVERVQDKKHFDPQVLSIIAQHEEIIDGTGFPQGLKESKIDPMAILVGSANRIDRMLTFERVKREELPLQLMMKYTGVHPLEHLKILTDLIKL